MGSKPETTEGLKYRIEKELNVELRNSNPVTLEHSGCSEGKVKLFGKQNEWQFKGSVLIGTNY